MSAQTSYEVAIIGAGLSGLALALALHQQDIRCVIYESRPAPLDIGGAVMLSPNALKIMDALKVYDNVKSKGYNFERLQFQTSDGQLIDDYEFGNEKEYGYKANRIYRFELVDILLAKLKSNNIAVEYGRKFSHVVKEDNNGVTWQFFDGTQSTASLLVGADGIHSTVRKYLYPDLTPKFMNMAGITSAVPASHVKAPSGELKEPLTIMSKGKGAFVIAPQKIDGSEFLIGKQKRMEEQTRQGWDDLLADKAAAVKFLQEDADAFGEIAMTATSNIPTEKVNIWPFYVIPKLDKWVSEKRRVIILGDSAHAVPPSAGQGINQAFEDVYMLALLLAEGHKGRVQMQNAFTFWQEYRQGRIDRVLELNRQIDQRRLPSDQRDTSQPTAFNLRWLYEPDFEKDVEKWVSSRT